MKFRHHLVWVLALGFVLAGFISLSRLQIENDLFALLPSEKSISLNKEILSGHPLNRRILFYAQSKKAGIPDFNALATLVEESFAAENISNWGRPELRQDAAELDTLRARVMGYLPWLLTPAELRREALLLQDTAELNRRLERVFQLLLSPGGRFVQDALLRDPLGLSSRWFARLEKMNGGRYRFTPDGLMTDSSETLLMGWITTHEGAENVAEARKLSEALSRVMERLRGQDVEIGFFGAPLVAAENARVIQRDVMNTLLFAFVSINLLLGFTFRSWSFLPVLLVTLLGGATGAIITAALMIPHVPALSLGLAAVFVGISVDYALHLLTLWAEGLKAKEVVRRVIRPMVLSMLTTVASFGILTFTESPVTQAFGWLAAGGILGSCLTALLVAPRLLSSLPQPSQSQALVPTLGRFRLPALVFIGVLSVVAFIFYESPTLDADPEKLSYLSRDLEKAEEVLEAAGGVRRKNMIILGESSDENAFYEQAEKVEALLNQPEWKAYVEVVSPSRLFPPIAVRLESARIWDSVFSGPRLRYLKSELDRRAASKGFRTGLFDNFFLNPRKAPSQNTPDLEQLLAILPAGLREMMAFTQDGKTYRTLIARVKPDKHDTLLTWLSSRASDLIILDRKQMADAFFTFLKKDFESVVNWSVLVVIGVLLAGFGRVELGATGFIPLAVAWLWLGALMALTSISFNIVSLIVCSFIFGLGVDYAVFYLFQQIHAYKYGKPPEPATAKAVKLSALTTLLATGGLILSRHPALYSIGILSLAGIGAVWLNAALLLPAIFQWLAVRPSARGLKPHTLKNLVATLLVWIGLVLPFLGAVFLAPFVYVLSAGRKSRIQNFFRYYIWLWANAYVRFVFFGRRRYVRINQVDFSRPVLVFANHQSLIDTALIFTLSPRLVIGTKNSIYNHPLFGPVSRLCGFINVSEGHEKYKPRVLELLKAGYSFALFPEGTRSADFEIHRFHSGLFDLALSSGCPLVPVVFVGTGHLLHKGAFWGSRQHLIMEVGPPVPVEADTSDGAARKLARTMAQHLRTRYNELLYRYGGGPVAADLVRHRYLYLNPDLEWYVRIKLKLENHYEYIHLAVPPRAQIVELGCGLGILGHILTAEFPERSYKGYDVDKEKIAIARARRGPRQSQVNFEAADITTLSPVPCDTLIVWDVLHYLPCEEQWRMMDAWAESLHAGGLIIIRDGLSDDMKKHRLTRFSEFLSIKVMRFNPGRETLHFPRKADVEAFIRRQSLEVVSFEAQRFSSNCLWILRKPQAMRSTTLPV